MPGNIVIKPIEANITHNVTTIGRMSPYYVITLGDSTQKGQVCKKGGKSPAWNDAVTVEKTSEHFCMVEVKAKRPLLPDKTIGVCMVNLDEINEQKSARWYDIVHHSKVAGKILIEANLLALPGDLVTSQTFQPMTRSVDVLDGRREPALASPNKRNMASLDNIPPRDEGLEVKVVNPTAERQDLVQAPAAVPQGKIRLIENAAENADVFVGVGEDFKHIDAINEVKEMGHGLNEVKVVQGDHVFDENIEIPEERNLGEGIQRVDADQLTRQREV